MTAGEIFIANARKIRRRRGLTQTEWARLMGFKVKAISDMERGARRIDVSEALTIASRLGYTVEEMCREGFLDTVQEEEYYDSEQCS